MVKTKKVLALLLVVSMILALALSACGRGTEGGGKSDTATTVQQNSGDGTQEVFEKVVLNYMQYGPGKKEDTDMVWAEFNKKLAEYLPSQIKKEKLYFYTQSCISYWFTRRIFTGYVS